MSDAGNLAQTASPPIHSEEDQARLLVEAVESLRSAIAPPLYITDAELIRRMGVPEKIARETISRLDDNPASGFPPKIKIWGDRRFWPAVLTYLEATCGLKIDASEPRRERHARQ